MFKAVVDSLPFDVEQSIGPMFNQGSSPEGLQSFVSRFEKNVILEVLEKHNWHRGKTAAALKIHYRSLLRKMKRYGIHLS